MNLRYEGVSQVQKLGSILVYLNGISGILFVVFALTFSSVLALVLIGFSLALFIMSFVFEICTNIDDSATWVQAVRFLILISNVIVLCLFIVWYSGLFLAESPENYLISIYNDLLGVLIALDSAGLGRKLGKRLYVEEQLPDFIIE